MLQGLLRRVGLRTSHWGDWASLDTPNEEPRYRAIEAIRLAYAPDGAVLDLGAGTGLVCRYLTTSVPYLGIERQRAAVSAGQRVLTTNQRLMRGDIGSPPIRRGAHFDLILFNEVLYYQPTIQKAVALVNWYRRHLSIDGVMLISICVNPQTPARMNNRMWDAIGTTYAPQIVEHRAVASDSVTSWQMAVLRWA